MSKKLAIRGHATRGKEVIKILEMLGGKHSDIHGNNTDKIYCIDDNGFCSWDYIGPDEMEEFIIFTLEEFLEKYPYKVGDFVRIADYESEVRIDDMQWDGYEIQYGVFTDETEYYTADELNNWNGKEINMKKNDILTLKGELYHNNRIAYTIPYGYEVSKIENGEIIIQKMKPTYPKAYGECYKVLNRNIDNDSIKGYNAFLLENLQMLLVCRDAYWKIVGEQMGLDKPWKPDWNDRQLKYCISMMYNTLCRNNYSADDKILAFPTEEMRNEFYENFKDLIENCKELL